MLLERQVSGMVFAGGQYAEADAPHEHYARLLKLRLPVVLVNAAAEHLDFPRVSTDDAVAMEQAYGHLASLGHERIGLIIGPADHVPSRRKLAAFETAARTAGTSAPDLIERTMFSLEGGHAAATRLIRGGATGIVCASDPMALGAIRAARRAGLSVPADISVVGYDDSAFMNCTDPPLTTIASRPAIGEPRWQFDGPDRGLGRAGRGALLLANWSPAARRQSAREVLLFV
jgi:DNA-binding LacI/PurR family transcriptional regulator